MRAEFHFQNRLHSTILYKPMSYTELRPFQVHLCLPKALQVLRIAALSCLERKFLFSSACCAYVWGFCLHQCVFLVVCSVRCGFVNILVLTNRNRAMFALCILLRPVHQGVTVAWKSWLKCAIELHQLTVC